MNSHGDAIDFLRRAGIPASRHDCALGDTVVVPLGRASDRGGITAYPTVAWLVPTAAAWRLEQPVTNVARIVPCSDLETACELAIVIARSFAPTERCADCGLLAELEFGERSTSGQLEFWTSLRCLHCGAQTESDGIAPLPDRLRDLELLRYGEWAVVVEAPLTTTQWKALRLELRLTPAALTRLKSRLPGIVFSGTFPEARHLNARLVGAGVVAHLEFAG